MTRTPIGIVRQSLLGTAVAGMIFFPAVPAIGNPTGANVVSGSADFQQLGNTLQITNSPGAIIDWQAFSIAQDEITRFQQQAANSAVLNRVVGGSVSQIMGQLVSNGQVFLINPNGMVFGQNVTVDTAGFVASTLDMSNEDFLAGNYTFEGDTGKIINEGYLTNRGGNIYFIAADIENSGVIHAEDGSLTLAAGERIKITSLDTPDIEFEVTAPENAIINLGALLADQGAVQAFAGTLTHSGEIRANNISLADDGSIVLFADGDITLTADSVIDASGSDGGDVLVQTDTGTIVAEGAISADGADGQGGRVRLLGEQVGLLGSASVSADGATGGGQVLIGGARQGEGPEPNARATFVGRETSISASATQSGDGGELIVFAEDLTRVYGDLEATGGPAAGDGGFIETSADWIEVTSTPDAGAANGAPGEWLIDPDLIVIAGAATTEVTEAPSAVFTADNAATAPTIGDQVIEAAIDGGTSVTVITAADNDAMGIQVNEQLDFNATTSGLSLTLNAANGGTGTGTIAINAQILNAGTEPLDYVFIVGDNQSANIGFNLDTGAGGFGTIEVRDLGFSGSSTATFTNAPTMNGFFLADTVTVSAANPIFAGDYSALQTNLTSGSATFQGIGSNVSDALDITGGTLTVDTQFGVFNTFSQAGGVVEGPGILDILGAGTISSAATHRGAGATVVHEDATLTLNSGLTLENTRVLQIDPLAGGTNPGLLTINNTSSLTLNDDTTLINDGDINVTDAGNINDGFGGTTGSLFQNFGVLDKNGAGEMVLSVTLTEQSGDFNANSGLLRVTADVDHMPGSTLNATSATYRIDSGTQSFLASTINGGFDLNGGGVALFLDDPVTTGFVESYAVADLLQSGGVVDGDGDLLLTGTAVVSSSSNQRGTGITTVLEDATLTLNSGLTLENTRVLQIDPLAGGTNPGLLTINNTSSLTLNDDTTLINDGDINVTDAGNINDGFGGTTGSLFQNFGVLDKNGAGEMVLSVTLTEQSGDFNANSGLLRATADVDHMPGSTLNATSATYRIDSGTQSFLASTINGGFDLNGGGVALFLDDPVTTGFVESYAVADLLQSGGVVDGDGDLLLTGTAVVSSSSNQRGTGITTVLEDATLTLNSGLTLENTRVLQIDPLAGGTNPGLLTINNTSSLTLNDDTTLINDGDINVTDAGNINDGFGGTTGSLFQNFGVLDKNGAGEMVLSVTLTEQSGDFNANSGLLRVTADVDHMPGSTLNATSATYRIDSGTQSFLASTINGGFDLNGGGVALFLDDPVTTGFVESYAVADLLQSGGVVDGDGDLLLTGTAVVSSSSNQRGTGITTVLEDATLTLNSGLTLENTRVLQIDPLAGGTNPGLLTINNTSSLTLNDDTTLINDGDINVTDAGNINDGFGGTTGSLFQNFGVLDKNGAGEMVLSVTLTEQSGDFNANSGLLRATADVDHMPGSTLNATSATYRIDSGTQSFLASTINGGFDLNGGGVALFLDDPVTTGFVESYAVADLLQSGGVVDGDGDLLLTGTAVVSSSSNQRGTGITTVLEDATLTLNSGLTLENTRVLQIDPLAGGTNPGLLTINNTSALTLNDDTTLISSGDIDINDAGDINDGFGGTTGSLFQNFGVLDKSGAGTTSIGVTSLQQLGVVNVDAGQLDLLADAVTNGAWTVNSGALINLRSALHDVNDGSSFAGTGTYSIGSGDTLRVLGGSATMSHLELNGGTVSGLGTLEISQSLMWNSGQVGNASDGGTLLLLGTAVADITTGSTKTIDNGDFVTDAGSSTTWDGGLISMRNNAGITNAGNFAFDVDNQIDTADATNPFFQNNGAITKSVTAGTTTIDVLLDNDGSMTATTGIISLQRDGNHDGDFFISAPGDIIFAGGVHSIGSGGSFNTDQDVLYDNQTLTISGGFSAGNVTIQNGSNITYNNTYFATTTTIDGMTTFANFNNNASATNALTISNGATIGGVGGFDVIANATLNNAFINFAGGSTLTIDGTATGTGAAFIGNGITDFEIGSFNLDSVSVSAGELRVANASSAGALFVSGGQLTVNSTLDVGTNFDLSGGSIRGAGGAVTVNGTGNLAGGVIGDSIDFQIGVTGDVDVTGFVQIAETARLSNFGTLTLTSDTSVIQINNDAIVVNELGGNLDILTDGDIADGPNGGFVLGSLFENLGTLTKLGAGGDNTLINVEEFSQQGLVQINAGAMVLPGLVNNGGTFVNAGILDLTGTFVMNGGAITGTAVNINGADLSTTTGATASIGAINLNSGSITTGMGSTLSITDQFTWNAGTIGSASDGITRVTGTASGLITSAGSKLLDGGLLLIDSNFGNPTVWNDGDIAMGAGAIMEVNGLLQVTGSTSSILEDVSAISSERLDVQGGILERSGAGLFNVDVATNINGLFDVVTGDVDLNGFANLNGGAVTVSADTLTFVAGGTSLGATFTANAPGTIDFGTPGFLIDSGFLVGDGTFTGNFTIAGLIGSIDSPMTFSDADIMTTGTLDVNALLTLEGTVNIDGDVTNNDTILIQGTAGFGDAFVTMPSLNNLGTLTLTNTSAGTSASLSVAGLVQNPGQIFSTVGSGGGAREIFGTLTVSTSGSLFIDVDTLIDGTGTGSLSLLDNSFSSIASGATLTVPLDAASNDFNLAGNPTLEVNGTLDLIDVGATVAPTWVWDGGSILGTGTVDALDVDLSIAGATQNLNGAQLLLQDLTLPDGLELIASGSATLDVAGLTQLLGGTLIVDSSTLLLGGALQLDGDALDGSIAALDLRNTSLSVNLGGDANEADFVVDAASSLNFTGGIYDFDDDVIISGAGLVSLDGATININDPVSGLTLDALAVGSDVAIGGTGLLQINDGGELQLFGTSSFGGTLNITEGTLRVQTDTAVADFTVANLTASESGTISLGTNRPSATGSTLTVTDSVLVIEDSFLDVIGNLNETYTVNVTGFGLDLTTTGGGSTVDVFQADLDLNAGGADVVATGADLFFNDASLTLRSTGAFALSDSSGFISNSSILFDTATATLDNSTLSISIPLGPLEFIAPTLQLLRDTSINLGPTGELEVQVLSASGPGNQFITEGTLTATDLRVEAGVAFFSSSDLQIANELLIAGNADLAGSIDSPLVTVTGGTSFVSGSVFTDSLQVTSGDIFFSLPVDALTVDSSGGNANFDDLTAMTLDVSGFGSVAITDTGDVDAVNLSGGTLFVDGTLNALDLVQDSGVVTGGGNLDISNTFTWSDGEQSGFGTTNLLVGSNLMTPAVTQLLLTDRTLNNAGSAEFDTTPLRLAGNAAVINSGMLTLLGDGSRIAPDPALGIQNTRIENTASGIIQADSTGSTPPPGFFASVNLVADNLDLDGTIDVVSGDLAISARSTGVIDAPLAAAPGGSLLLITEGSLAVNGNVTAPQLELISFNGGNVTVNGSLSVDALALAANATLNTDVTVNDLLISASTDQFSNVFDPNIDNNANLTATGSLEWRSGSLGGTGSTTVAATANLLMPYSPGQAVSLVDHTLEHASTTGTSLISPEVLVLDGNAVFRNTGILRLQADPDAFSLTDGTGTFTNEGTFTFDPGFSTDTASGNRFGNFYLFIPRFDNSGTVTVERGFVRFENGGTHTGNFIAPGAIEDSTADAGRIRFRGDHTFTSTSTFNGPSFGIQGGGTAVFDGVLNTESLFLSGDGDLILNSDADVRLFSLIGFNDPSIDSPRIAGTGNINVSEQFSWSGGTITGTGDFTVAPAAIAFLGDSFAELEVPQLTLDGRDILYSAAGESTVFEQGTLTLQNGATFTNAGTLRIEDPNGANVAIATDATSNFINSGTLSIATPLDLTATTNSSGAISVEGAALTASALTLTTGSTLDVATTRTATLTNLVQTGGTVSGAGELLLLGAANLGAGTHSGTGTTRIATGASAGINGLTLTTGRTLSNEGTLNLGTGVLSLNGATLTNPGNIGFSGATASINGDASGLFTNTGAVSGSSSLQLGVNTNQLGTLATAALQLTAGDTLSLQTGSTTTITGDFDSAGTLTLAGGALTVETLLNTGTINGIGTLNGNLSNSGLITPGNSPGTLTVAGDFVQTAAGTLLIEIDGAGTDPGTDFDVFAITGDAQFDGTLQLAALENFSGTLGEVFTPISYGSGSGAFATVIQPGPELTFVPVIGANGVTTTLVQQNGEIFDPDRLPDNPEEAREIAEEVISQCPEERQEVDPNNSTAREQNNEEAEQNTDTDVPPDPSQQGSQGVGCSTG